MRPGIFRIVALLLAVLGASPFTAPFSVCELQAASDETSARQHQTNASSRRTITGVTAPSSKPPVL